MQGRIKEFSVKEEILAKVLFEEGFSVWAASRAILSVKYGLSGEMDWMGGEDGEEEILGAAREWLFGHLGQEGVNEQLEEDEARFDDAVLARSNC